MRCEFADCLDEGRFSSLVRLVSWAIWELSWTLKRAQENLMSSCRKQGEGLVFKSTRIIWLLLLLSVVPWPSFAAAVTSYTLASLSLHILLCPGLFTKPWWLDCLADSFFFISKHRQNCLMKLHQEVFGCTKWFSQCAMVQTSLSAELILVHGLAL